MLITRRMEDRGLLPGGFVANDYCLAVWGLKPVTDPAPLLSPDILTDEFVEWVTESHLLRRAFREVAVISGLVERQHPGQKKTGKQVTFSTDLIYDVLRKYEPDHVLIEAAWADARARMTDVGRLGDLLGRRRVMLMGLAVFTLACRRDAFSFNRIDAPCFWAINPARLGTSSNCFKMADDS
mgnify:CR=1 FL=1